MGVYSSRLHLFLSPEYRRLYSQSTFLSPISPTIFSYADSTTPPQPSRQFSQRSCRSPSTASAHTPPTSAQPATPFSNSIIAFNPLNVTKNPGSGSDCALISRPASLLVLMMPCNCFSDKPVICRILWK